jgi:FimV-like protein
LQLAIAYQEIGEKSGACLLLEELIADATDDQSEEARAILEQAQTLLAKLQATGSR